MSQASNPRRVRSRRLHVAELVERLRLQILNEELPPGTRLRQLHLARRFGVSVNAVREALMELKGGGWVESVRYQGVHVARFDTRQLLEVLEVREVLEGLAARLCCRRINRESLAELRHLAGAIYALGCRPDPADRRDEIGLDREFHARLAQIAGNQTLARLAEANRAMVPYLATVRRNPAVTRDEHLAILQAIEEDRPDDAERIVRAHVRRLGESIRKAHAAGQLTLGTTPPAGNGPADG